MKCIVLAILVKIQSVIGLIYNNYPTFLFASYKVFFQQNFMFSWLTSNNFHSWGLLWTYHPPASTSHVLGLPVCATRLVLCSAGDQTQGLIYARQARCYLSHIPQPHKDVSLLYCQLILFLSIQGNSFSCDIFIHVIVLLIFFPTLSLNLLVIICERYLFTGLFIYYRSRYWI